MTEAIDGVQPKPCVGCGFCCNKAPCALASSLGLAKDGKCKELLWASGRYWCGLMLDAPKVDDRDENWYKRHLCAGEGCCSPLNSIRQEIVYENLKFAKE